MISSGALNPENEVLFLVCVVLSDSRERESAAGKDCVLVVWVEAAEGYKRNPCLHHTHRPTHELRSAHYAVLISSDPPPVLG